MKTAIPDAALDSHIAVLGKTGSGKSNLAKVIAEKLMIAGKRTCTLDPTGTWWGLRLDSDGKAPSRFKPVIFGGAHADLALSEQHGAVLGEAVGTSADSCIVDVQQMTVGQRTRFSAAFAEALMRANRGPLHLIIDEAHLFAPQSRVNDPQSGAMLHAFNNLVSLGRGRGLRIILISQRPAKLHKDSLTQVETLIAMRLIAPQDRAAVKDWIGEWADDGAEIVNSLPSLDTGEGWVWSPQLNHLERTKFPLAATFDSGRPEANAKARNLPLIDLDKISELMTAIEVETAGNDPRLLKRKVAELEATIRKQASSEASKEIKIDDLLQQYNAGYRVGRQDAVRDMKLGLDRLTEQIGYGNKALLSSAQELGARADEILAAPLPKKPNIPRLAPDKTEPSSAPPKVQTAAKPAPVVANGDFTGPQTKILRALAMWKVLGNNAPTKQMIAFVAGYSPKSSGFSNLMGGLRSAGAIDYPAANCAALRVDGFDMSIDEGKAAFFEQLSAPQQKLVRALAGGVLSKEELAAASGYSVTSSGYSNLLGGLRSLTILDYPQPGHVELNGWVFDLL